jgi:predicted tellurium resistance membrane protein TerC
VDGSNPSLLKKSAILFLVCIGLTLIGNEFEVFKSVIVSLMEGIVMETSYTAVTFAICKSVFGAVAAVMAGLAANGVTPHLFKSAFK